VDQLQSLVDAVGTQPFTSVQSLTAILSNALSASVDGLESKNGVPQSWLGCSSRDIGQVIETLDPLSTGMVNTRKFLVDLILMECGKPDKESLDKSIKGCTAKMSAEGTIGRDQFNDVAMWFAK